MHVKNLARFVPFCDGFSSGVFENSYFILEVEVKTSKEYQLLMKKL